MINGCFLSEEDLKQAHRKYEIYQEETEMIGTNAKRKRMEIVKQMYEEKKTEEEIAKKLGISKATVYSYLKELGLKANEKEKLKKRILEMYSGGVRIEEIGKSLKTSRKYIKGVLGIAGLVSVNRRFIEKDLIDENTIFADNSPPILESLIIDGKRYADITPVFSPR